MLLRNPVLHYRFHKYYFKILPIMLALCLVLSETCYAQNYAGIIDLDLVDNALVPMPINLRFI